MKKRVRAALAAATLAGGAVATVTAATPAFAAGGGINVTAACKAQYPNALEEWLVTAVAADAGSIYGWQCWDGSVYELGGVLLALHVTLVVQGGLVFMSGAVQGSGAGGQRNRFLLSRPW